MNRPDAIAWGSVLHDWGGAYLLRHDTDPGNRETFTAQRRDDPGAVLTSGTPEGLGEKIAEDYRRKPVPREVAP